MAIKTIPITWEGKEEVVEYEDDIPFGDVEKILAQTVDLTDVTKPKVRLAEYRAQIFTAVVRKAPFPTNYEGVRKIPRSIAKKIMMELMKDYNLNSFLEDWMTSWIGSLESPEKSTTSTPTVQDSSVGPNPK